MSALELLDDYPSLEVRAIATEYDEGLRHVRKETERAKLIVWLGSSIGNLGRDEARGFLKNVRGAMSERDRLLVGIDLRKDHATLEAAYDDAAGVTARFSLNLLERLNRELDADFDLGQFRHTAVYREDEGRVHIEIQSRARQRVHIGELDLAVDFEAGEGIHTESAYKYSFDEIDTLARGAGLQVEQRWTDARGRFSLNLFGNA